MTVDELGKALLGMPGKLSVYVWDKDGRGWEEVDGVDLAHDESSLFVEIQT